MTATAAVATASRFPDAVHAAYATAAGALAENYGEVRAHIVFRLTSDEVAQAAEDVRRFCAHTAGSGAGWKAAWERYTAAVAVRPDVSKEMLFEASAGRTLDAALESFIAGEPLANPDSDPELAARGLFHALRGLPDYEVRQSVRRLYAHLWALNARFDNETPAAPPALKPYTVRVAAPAPAPRVVEVDDDYCPF